MVVIDATMLLLLLRPNARVPGDVEHPRKRIDFLIQRLSKTKSKIIIPTPALSEALVSAGPEASQQIVDHIQKYSVFAIESFDARAAIEVAAMSREARAMGSKKGAANSSPWAKVKYDRQIVAIAKVNRARTIYSDDDDIRKLGALYKIEVCGLADLPLPEADAQLNWLTEPNATSSEGENAPGTA